MTHNPESPSSPDGEAAGPAELELTDEDILDAMRRIPGYLDISTEDFRSLYHLAHAHAIDRLFRRITAAHLMLKKVQPLRPETPLDAAARQLVNQGRKSLPVVDGENRVVGILTETDFLRRLQAVSFLELLLRLVEDRNQFSHRCQETPVSAAMTRSVVTISQDAGFSSMVKAFHRHGGRSMPVVDSDGRFQGLLLRKDFIKVQHLESRP